MAASRLSRAILGVLAIVELLLAVSERRSPSPRVLICVTLALARVTRVVAFVIAAS